MSTPAQKKIVIVTGLSGAGLSTALKALEDLGYEAVDNLPLSLLASLIQDTRDHPKPLAIGMDGRTWGLSATDIAPQIDKLKALPNAQVDILFLESTDDVLQRRFTETRRRHPLAGSRSVAEGITRERALLAPLRDRATGILDTSALSIHDLRRWLAGQYPPEKDAGLRIFLMSFAYRNGLPREADLVFDVRFLANPHYDPALRPLTGKDAAVAEKIAADPDYPVFFQNLTALIGPLLPRYAKEGKSYLTIAIGCTGGRHRSVYVVEQLARWLKETGFSPTVQHREWDSR